MDTNLINYQIDVLFELELSQDRKSFEDGFIERYKVLNSNIELTKKIKEQAFQKNSNENVIIWNLFGFLNILEYDLTSVGYNLVFENKPWQKVYYARQVSLIIYEAFIDIPQVLGKNYKQIFKGFDNAQPYIDVLNGYKKELEALNKQNIKYLKDIRMNVSAHRDQDIDNQLEVIGAIDPYKIIKIMYEFEKVLRRITDHIEIYLVHSLKLEK
jgi:hypothetical protein